ncbi:MAG: GNAT family N-acetyltransferase [Chloroflexi bacterium]|nr:GNAT family N-acetyltransferase [Chloroflexota bacterium]
MDNRLFTGELTKLTACNPESDAKIMEVWHRDTEFFRLAYGRIAQPWSVEHIKKRIENHGGEVNEPVFAIRTLADDKLIGQIGLWIEPSQVEGFVWILIGERDYWGRGFGTDAMRVLLRYAFRELNLHRVVLRVFAFNTRAIRSYEKVGYVHEGRVRNALNRMGQRWDEVWMGITRSDWERQSAAPKNRGENNDEYDNRSAGYIKPVGA